MNRAGTTVRVMTWNIHSGVGTDGRFDLTRVVETIARHHPDVVALQEVDSRQTLAPARSAFAVLRDAVGEHGIEAKSIITADGAYGQMVVSRWPLGATQIHDITHAKREPRRAIEVEIATPTGAFRLIAAHFGLTLTERRQHARRLVAIARPHAMTTVMLGDFNEWFWPASLRGELGRLVPAFSSRSHLLLAVRRDADELCRSRGAHRLRSSAGGRRHRYRLMRAMVASAFDRLA